MAVILVVLGVLAGLIAAKAVKKGSPPVPSMAIDEARKIRESVGAGAAPVESAAGSVRYSASGAGGQQLMAQRTPAEIRSSIEANRMELAVSVQHLRGEVTRLTDWRAHVERHRSEITDRRGRRRTDARHAHGAPSPPSPLSATWRPCGAQADQASSVRGIAPTPIRPGPV